MTDGRLGQPVQPSGGTGFETKLIGRVLIAIWSAEMLPEHFSQLTRIGRGELAGADFAVCSIIGPATPMALDSKVRYAAAALQSEFEDRTIAAATIVVGSGLRASLVRGVLTGVGLLARGKKAVAVFAEPDATSDWILRADGDLAPAQELRRVLREAAATVSGQVNPDLTV